MRFSLLAFAGMLAVVAAYEIENINILCVYALMDIYGDFSFTGPGYGDYYVAMCTNPLPLISMYAAAHTYCSDTAFSYGYAQLSIYCTEYGEVTLRPESDFAANLTAAAIAALPVYGQDDLDETVNQTAAFMVDSAWYQLAYETEANERRETVSEYGFGAGIYGFWGAILAYGIVQNLIRHLLERRRGYVAADAEGGRRPASLPAVLRPVATAYAWLRKHAITPSLVSSYHDRRILGCTVPTRAESFAIFGFWIYSIITSAVDIRAFKGDIYWPTIAPQVWQHMADRTGTLAYYNLPLIWMFSGRNNVFQWLTGWSFGTFNMFHRHIARIAAIQGILHSIGWTCYFFAAGYGSYYYLDIEDMYFYMGVGATCVMSLLILFSFSYFRQKFYESFLLIHILFSILLIMFLYYHTNIYDMEDYNNPFLIPPIVIWSLDRAARLVRQAYCNFHVRCHAGKGLRHTTATVAFDAATEMLTIDVVPPQTRLGCGPGQHYYLYQPLRLFGWENHPFTLAHWAQQEDGLHLQFFVRPYDGWTKTLHKRCLAAASPAPLPLTLLLEGPYGKHEPLHTFDHVLLVAGGSGIAGVLPYLLDHVARAENKTTVTTTVTFVWADRSAAYMRQLAVGPLKAALGRADVAASFYLGDTACDSTETVVTEKMEKTSTDGSGTQTPTEASGVQTPTETADIQIQSGRPDVAALVQQAASVLSDGHSRLAVLVCGPASLSDTARAAAVQAMEPERDSLEFFQEKFGW